MSVVPVGRDYDHSAEPRREHVLAVSRLRRSLECLSAEYEPQGRLSVAVNTTEIARVLEELIAALDRRVPRVERAGEAVIAREAAALRAKAVTRLAELGDDHAGAR